MLRSTFYHKSIKKYVTYFGTLFNDIYINRYDSNNEAVQSIKVPIFYGPKDKALARLNSDPDLDRPYATILPRMSFEITGMQYAAERKLNTTGRVYGVGISTEKDKTKYMFNPVPYDITFNLNIMVKNAEDGAQIVEQILPFFTPDWTATLNMVPEMDYSVDVPLVLNSVTLQDTYEGSFVERRVLTYTLTFVMKAMIFGPVKKAKVIKFVQGTITPLAVSANISTNVGSNSATTTISITPGVAANGSPTTNSSISVSYANVSLDDDFGFIVGSTNDSDR